MYRRVEARTGEAYPVRAFFYVRASSTRQMLAN
jgi:hypothetical protein